MASSHIEITGTTRLGAMLRSAIDQARQSYESMEQINAIMLAYEGDYVSMASDFGFVGGNAAANVQAVYGILTSDWTNAINSTINQDLVNEFG